MPVNGSRKRVPPRNATRIALGRVTPVPSGSGVWIGHVPGPLFRLGWQERVREKQVQPPWLRYHDDQASRPLSPPERRAAFSYAIPARSGCRIEAAQPLSAETIRSTASCQGGSSMPRAARRSDPKTE